MDLRALIAKMDAIESGLSEDRAEYDQFKAQDAKAAAMEKVKQYASIPLAQIPRLANAIDPKTGIIYYGDGGGEGSGDGNPKKMPLQFMSQPDQKPMLDAINTAGLSVIPHEEKTLFGSAQYAKVEPGKLASVLAGVSPEDDLATLEKLKKLIVLVKKYKELQAKRAASGATPTTAQGASPTVKESVNFKGSIARSLTESFGYQTDESVMGVLGKAAVRAAPGAGAVLGAQGAMDSFKKGDYLGAALNGLSGAFSLVPGLGWIPALGFGAIQAGRELSGSTSKYDTPKPGEPAKPGAPATPGAPAKPGTSAQGAQPTATGNGPKLQELQKKLIAAGADLGPTGADGVMGKYTQAAMQKFPNIKEGVTMTQPKSVAESIRELQQRLESIETGEAPVQTDAPPPPAEGEPIVQEEPTPGTAETPEPIPASAEDNELAELLKQKGGVEMMMGGKKYMVFPDKGIAVLLPSMDIVDASTSALTPTGKKFDPAALGLSESLDEGIWDSIMKGAVNVGKNFAGGLGGRTAVGLPQTALTMPGKSAAQIANAFPQAATKTAKFANKTGSAIAKNPVKTGLAATAAGLGAGYLGGSSGQDSTAPTAPATPGTTGQGTNPTPTPTAPGGDDDEMKALRAQIDALIKDLSTSKNPEVIKGLADVQAMLK